MEVKKDDVPVIFKQDIMYKNGKLNLVGAFLVISVLIGALDFAFNYLQDNVVDKDKVN